MEPPPDALALAVSPLPRLSAPAPTRRALLLARCRLSLAQWRASDGTEAPRAIRAEFRRGVLCLQRELKRLAEAGEGRDGGGEGGRDEGGSGPSEAHSASPTAPPLPPSTLATLTLSHVLCESHFLLGSFLDASWTAALAARRAPEAAAERGVLAEKTRQLRAAEQAVEARLRELRELSEVGGGNRRGKPLLAQDRQLRRLVAAREQIRRVVASDREARRRAEASRTALFVGAVKAFAEALRAGGGHDVRAAFALCRLALGAGRADEGDEDEAEAGEEKAREDAAGGAGDATSSRTRPETPQGARRDAASAHPKVASRDAVSARLEAAAEALDLAPAHKLLPLAALLAARLEGDEEAPGAATPALLAPTPSPSAPFPPPHPPAELFFQRSLASLLVRLARARPAEAAYVLLRMAREEAPSGGGPGRPGSAQDARALRKHRAAQAVLHRAATGDARAGAVLRPARGLAAAYERLATGPLEEDGGAGGSADAAGRAARPGPGSGPRLPRAGLDMAARAAGAPLFAASSRAPPFGGGVQSACGAERGGGVEQGAASLPPASPYVAFVRILPACRLASGVHRPRLVRVLGSDGTWRRQLLKGGGDDLRQDEVMELFFWANDTFLRDAKAARRRALGVRTYPVVPLARRAGVVGWVDGARSLGDVLVGPDGRGGAHAAYAALDDLFGAEGASSGGAQGAASGAAAPGLAASGAAAPPPARSRPLRRLTFPETSRQMAAAQATGDAVTMRQTYDEVLCRFPPVLGRFVRDSSSSARESSRRRLSLARSLASGSAAGHAVGLGDRHAQNILVDLPSMQLVHIDLGIALEQGRFLPIPERVPFRLTPNLVDGLGPAGVAGAAGKALEAALAAARADAPALASVVELLVHDPLCAWTATPHPAQGEGSSADEPRNGRLAPGRETPKRAAAKRGEAANADAARALLRVRQKLLGREEGSELPLSVEGQAALLLRLASDRDNLATMYVGWASWL